MLKILSIDLTVYIIILIETPSNARLSPTQNIQLAPCNSKDCRELFKWWPDLMEDYKEKSEKEESNEKETYKDDTSAGDSPYNNLVEEQHDEKEDMSNNEKYSDLVNYDAFFPAKDEESDTKTTLMDLL